MTEPTFPGRSFFHGSKANLKPGDLIRAGYNSNYGKRAIAAYVYFSSTLNAAIWGAELALGDGPGRIYVVEATGPIENDPNLTDKKFPGNPTLSYRSKDPLRVIGEVIGWQGHSAEELNRMKAGVERARELGVEAIENETKCGTDRPFTIPRTPILNAAKSAAFRMGTPSMLYDWNCYYHEPDPCDRVLPFNFGAFAGAAVPTTVFRVAT